MLSKYLKLIFYFVIAVAVIAIALILFIYECREIYNVYDDKKITVWGNYVIFDKYKSPFPPTENYIYMDNTACSRMMWLGITTDSVMGILCSEEINYNLPDFKLIEILGQSPFSWELSVAEWKEKYDISNNENVLYNVFVMGVTANRNYIGNIDYRLNDSVLVKKEYTVSLYGGGDMESLVSCVHDTIHMK